MKQNYITPQMKVIQLLTDDNIAQFVVSSHSVGENEGLSKEGDFDDEWEEDTESTSTGYDLWKR